MQSWIHGLDPNSFEVSGKTPAAFNSGRTGAHLASISVPEESLLELVRSLLTNYFFRKKMKLVRTEVLPRNMLVLTRRPSGNHLSDDVSQLRHRNDQGYSGLGVHLTNWAPGSMSPHWRTATGGPEQHCPFPSRKPPAFWLCWVTFTLVLVKWKTSATLSLSRCPPAQWQKMLVLGRRSVSSLMLSSNLDSRPRWTQEAFRSSSDVVLMPHSCLAAVWALYHCC